MSDKPMKSYKDLRGKQKMRIQDRLYKDVLLYCIDHKEEMDEQEKRRLVLRFCYRVRSLSAQISEEDASRFVEKRLPAMIDRAKMEVKQREILLPSAQHLSDEKLSERQKWARNFTQPVGKGDALIKGYKRQFSLDRVQALKELQAMGYVFSQEIIDRQYRIMKTEKQQKAAKKRKRKLKKQEYEQSVFHEDQDDRFFYIAGYTSGGAPYGVTWEEMQMNPFEYTDEEDDLTDE